MTAIPGEVRERLRHKGRDHVCLLGKGMHHVPEEDRPVACRERVVVGEVLLELTVRVLVVVRVVAPAEVVAVPRNRGQEVVPACKPCHVVARLLERVLRIGKLDRAVLSLLDEEVLELDPHLQLEAALSSGGEDPPQDRPRAVGPLLALDGDVAGKAREIPLPGNRSEARQIRHGRDVWIAWHLADLACCEAGEPGALGHEVVEVRGRNELRARPSVHVDELGEVELDPLFFLNATNVIKRGHSVSSPPWAATTLPRSRRPCDGGNLHRFGFGYVRPGGPVGRLTGWRRRADRAPAEA